ncbi:MULTISPECIES: hypothetical protein [unclassified Nocardia]|uniref:hypothetical protein n=1 Tax=unclassified Nocardia TaxID=2637762 RepID=UPI001CE47DD8|nr:MULTISPECIES: hypothetical protein [unclassified Nocardia]
MLTLKMSDAAVKVLGVLDGFTGLEPPAGLAAELRPHVESGFSQHDDVITWADSSAVVDKSARQHFDLTGWECAASLLHLEDYVPVTVGHHDGRPIIAEADQRVLLQHGIALARTLASQVYTLVPRIGVRFIIDANDSNATFRFHRIRPGEEWNLPDLDTYINSKPVVVDIEPFDRIG